MFIKAIYATALLASGATAVNLMASAATTGEPYGPLISVDALDKLKWYGGHHGGTNSPCSISTNHEIPIACLAVDPSLV